MRRIICFFKRHKRGNTKYLGRCYWKIECVRCQYKIQYRSPCARLVGIEMACGFDGN